MVIVNTLPPASVCFPPEHINPSNPGCFFPAHNVMAIGKFESMHIGHRALIHKAKERSKQLGLPSVIMSFFPHPFTVLGDKNYKPLLAFSDVLYILSEVCKVDFFLQYPFTKAVSKLHPEEFCKILFYELNAKELFVGEDYRFAVNRSGTGEHLKKEALRYGAKVNVVPFEKHDGAIISTSNIRKLIEQKNYEAANKMLGFEHINSHGIIQRVSPLSVHLQSFRKFLQIPYEQ